MRDRFNAQLKQLNINLIQMGALCEQAIAAAAKAMIDNDSSLLPQVIAAETQIDHMERDIEALCMKLLLQQQPVARDLRAISSALKMISDMERIGDQAADIAEILSFQKGRDLTVTPHIAEMARATIQMVTDSVESFVEGDLAMANAVVAYDDVVDDLFTKVKLDLTRDICANPENGELFLDHLMIAKYLERIGDHAVNLAQWVCRSITGSRGDREE